MASAGIALVERARLIHEIAGPDYSTLLNLNGKECTAKIGLAVVRMKLSGLNTEICMLTYRKEREPSYLYG